MVAWWTHPNYLQKHADAKKRREEMGVDHTAKAASPSPFLGKKR
jgi:hypothetical protein